MKTIRPSALVELQQVVSAGRELQAHRLAVCDAERCSIMERFEELHGTLNGKPAVISGRLLAFPVVAALDGSCQAEWPWSTLRRLVDSGRVALKT